MLVILEGISFSMPVASIRDPPRLANGCRNERRGQLQNSQGDDSEDHSYPFLLSYIFFPTIQNIPQKRGSVYERVERVKVVKEMIYDQVEESSR
jgi:hypothetical protein